MFNWILNQINELGSKIEVDPRRYILVDRNSVTIWGRVDGTVKSITYNTIEDAARVLKKNKKIDEFHGVGNEVVMYQHNITMDSNRAWMTIKTPVELCDLEYQFSPSLVKRLLAVKELKAINKVCNMIEDVALNFFCFQLG